MKRLTVIFSMLLISALTAGCAAGLGGESYSRSEAGTMQRVQYATIVSLRPVKIEGTKSGVGTAAGAVAGGVAASGVSGGRTGTVAAVIGAVLGGPAGSAMEEGMTRTDGVEFGLKLDDGREISVVQGLSPNEVFRVGDKVRVITGGGRTRVAH